MRDARVPTPPRPHRGAGWLRWRWRCRGEAAAVAHPSAVAPARAAPAGAERSRVAHERHLHLRLSRLVAGGEVRLRLVPVGELVAPHRRPLGPAARLGDRCAGAAPPPHRRLARRPDLLRSLARGQLPAICRGRDSPDRLHRRVPAAEPLAGGPLVLRAARLRRALLRQRSARPHTRRVPAGGHALPAPQEGRAPTLLLLLLRRVGQLEPAHTAARHRRRRQAALWPRAGQRARRRRRHRGAPLRRRVRSRPALAEAGGGRPLADEATSAASA
mmetsp:Transcript_23119/g.73349  ORF Transcript_23119/g.73349 Transcript_23119/m.73349 type:complete len:273 (-) Transcript_23119:53-871(-)